MIGGTGLWKVDASATRLLWSLSVDAVDLVPADDGGWFVIGTDGPTSASAFQRAVPRYVGPPPPVVGGPQFPAWPYNGFVGYVSSSGVWRYGSFLGGENRDRARAVAVDSGGEPVVVGWTESTAFPTRLVTSGPSGQRSPFIAKLRADLSDLQYSTYVVDSEVNEFAGIVRHPAGGMAAIGNTRSKAVLYRISSRPEPRLVRVDAVWNAASLSFTPLAPAELVTTTGRNFGIAPTVWLGSRELIVVSATDDVIHAKVPDDAGASRSRLSIRVVTDRGESNAALMDSARVAPGLFSADLSGSGHALARNEDGTANSALNPARVGSTVTLLANGLNRSSPVLVHTGSQTVAGDIDEASPLGSATSQLLQQAQAVRVTLSVTLTPGRIPIVAETGGIRSQPGVWIYVK